MFDPLTVLEVYFVNSRNVPLSTPGMIPGVFRRQFLRSHGNSRGVNGREVRFVFGHSSESSGWILTKTSGNRSYRPPGAL